MVIYIDPPPPAGWWLFFFICFSLSSWWMPTAWSITNIMLSIPDISLPDLARSHVGNLIMDTKGRPPWSHPLRRSQQTPTDCCFDWSLNAPRRLRCFFLPSQEALCASSSVSREIHGGLKRFLGCERVSPPSAVWKVLSIPRILILIAGSSFARTGRGFGEAM